MKNRDTVILVIAIVCGFLAFAMILNMLKRPASRQPATVKTVVGQRSMSIPTGMNALTLSPKEIDNVPDLLTTGNYIDILGIAPDYKGGKDLQTIVRSAEVLSVEKTKDKGVQSITVALSSVGAEVVAKAMEEGKIRMLLRPDGGEKSVFKVGEMSFAEVIRGVKKEKSVHV